MSARTVPRIAARTAPRTLALTSTLPRFALASATTGCLHLALASTLPVPRLFSSTRLGLSKDATWRSRGVVKYSELKPETCSPSGEITIIDVREANEVAQGIIPSAVNVPLSQFQTAFTGSGGDFVREYAFNRPKYDDKIIFYCRSGKRSQQATEFAQKQGWWNVRNYEGSWLDWVQQEEARGQASKIKEDED